MRELAFLNGVKQVTLRVVRIVASHLIGLLTGKIPDALFRLEVPLHVEQFVPGIDETEGMAAEAVHVPIAVRRAAIGEKNRDLVKRFGRERPEVPHHRGRLEVGLRIALLSMNEVAELQRIANEKHRGVVADYVPVAFFGVELERKPPGVPFGVGRAFLAPDG